MKNLYSKLSLFSVLALVAFEPHNLQATSNNPSFEEIQDSQKSQISLTPQFRDLIYNTLHKIKDGRYLTKRSLKTFSKVHLGQQYLEEDTSMAELEIFDSMITPDDNLFDSWITLISHCSKKNPNFDHSLKVAKERGESEQATPVAQYNLGLMYSFGHGINQDMIKAVEFYQKASDRGHAASQYELGLIYQEGEGVVKKDIIKAVEFYQKASDRGHAVAQYELGLIYQEGKGTVVEKNTIKAVEFYQKAADQGHAAAQYELGFIYKEGKIINQDKLLAIKWFLESAKKQPLGIKEALRNLIITFRSSTIKPEVEIKLIQDQKKLKDNIEYCLKLHKLEKEVNDPDSDYRKHKWALSSLLLEPYKRIVKLEETLLETIKALDQSGFMVTCLKINDDLTENYKSSCCPDIKYHELKKGKVSFTFGQDNIKVADEIMAVFSPYRPVDHDISFIKSILTKIQKSLTLGDQLTDTSKQLMIQYKSRVESNIEKQTWDMTQISPDHDPLLEKVEEEIKMLEELPYLRQQLQYLLIEGAPVRNKLFLENNKYIKHIFKG